MKAILSKKWYGVPILVFALVAVLGVGAVYAAMTLTTHGTVTVVADTTPPTYLFKVYDAVSGGQEIAAEDSTFFNLGSVTASATFEKTVYVAKAGTGSVTVTPSLSNLDPATGTIGFTPASVLVTNGTRLPIVVKFTAGPSPAAADAFDITFTGSP